jgi:hypothetical protein
MFYKIDYFLTTLLTQAKMLFFLITYKMQCFKKNIFLRYFQSMNIGENKYKVQYHLIGGL